MGVRRGLGRNRRRQPGDTGAALVEFAILMPFLLLLLLGIVEFAWLFSMNLNVRHGAREGARLVAVNFQPSAATGSAQTTEIVLETCSRMDAVAGADMSVSGDTGAVGDPGQVAVRVDNPSSLTGFLDWLYPSELRSTVEIRLEQPPTWFDTLQEPCP